jgi:hypothetical protein
MKIPPIKRGIKKQHKAMPSAKYSSIPPHRIILKKLVDRSILLQFVVLIEKVSDRHTHPVQLIFLG